MSSSFKSTITFPALPKIESIGVEIKLRSTMRQTDVLSVPPLAKLIEPDGSQTFFLRDLLVFEMRGTVADPSSCDSSEHGGRACVRVNVCVCVCVCVCLYQTEKKKNTKKKNVCMGVCVCV